MTASAAQKSQVPTQAGPQATTLPPIRRRQTKIVATVGPASASEEMLRKLYVAGVDVFRLNFSHGTHDDHRARVEAIRRIETEFGAPIGILADLQGPKLRVGKFRNGFVELQHGHVIRLDLDETEGDETRVNLPHPEIIQVLEPGAFILVDDGKVRMRITEKGGNYLMAELVSGSKLSNNKGVNVPNTVLPIPALTEKDRRDLTAVLTMDVDWVAQSFVQRPEDVIEARQLIGGKCGLLAKIEKPSALEHFDEILKHVDAIMLARGDLGVEIPAENVPSVQKHIVRKVRESGKPIIVATQMLESMIDSPSPTRAEASDVATAVYDGADAVMLSAETAAGKYPMEAVSIMDRICQRTEADDIYRRTVDEQGADSMDDASDAVTIAACEVARVIEAVCIASHTSSGGATLRAARQRPPMPILSLSHNLATARRLVMSYGVHAQHVVELENFGVAVQEALKHAVGRGLAHTGQKIVVTAGVPFGQPGSTNSLRVVIVE